MKRKNYTSGHALGVAALAYAVSLTPACSQGTTSSVKDLAAAQQIDPNAANAASAPIQYPAVLYKAIGDLDGKGHQFGVVQTLHATTSDQHVLFDVSGFHVDAASAGAQGAGQVNAGLAPDNSQTEYQRLDSAALVQLEGSDPTYKGGDGAFIFITGLTKGITAKHAGGTRHYSFTPAVPFMAIPSSEGSYDGIGGGLSFPTVVNWGARNHPATVAVSRLSADPAATVLRVTLRVADDPENLEAIPFPADARYVIDTAGERISAIWTKDTSSSGPTELYYQLCTSTLPDAGDPANFANGACDSFAKGVIARPPPNGPAASGAEGLVASPAKIKKKKAP